MINSLYILLIKLRYNLIYWKRENILKRLRYDDFWWTTEEWSNGLWKWFNDAVLYDIILIWLNVTNLNHMNIFIGHASNSICMLLLIEKSSTFKQIKQELLDLLIISFHALLPLEKTLYWKWNEYNSPSKLAHNL